MKDITDDRHKMHVEKALDIMAIYKRYEDVITIGAYKEGTNPKLDYAIKMMDKLKAFLKQDITDKVYFEEGLNELYKLFE
jgi:flagellum-specific ATP synthase